MIIAVTNRKGGVGKSTIASHIAAGLATKGYYVGLVDTDSQGNLYATETYTGARVQRFLYKGVGPVTKAEQGVLWPQQAR